jgi:LDH2 family malate/lactate/ureidoglycolate dehydrogenase
MSVRHQRMQNTRRYWVDRMARQGLIGIALSQSPEYVAPHGSSQAVFGTNPIAVGAEPRGGSLLTCHLAATSQRHQQSIPWD